jgi:type IV pilus assembly protein PilC
MASKHLENSALSVFFESLSAMMGAGIQVEEAVSLLNDGKAGDALDIAIDSVYHHLDDGGGLSRALATSGAFPDYAVRMVAVGEESGCTEEVLANLSIYYEEEERLQEKVQSNITYPLILLVVMSIVLIITVFWVLPVFVSSYKNFTSGITARSYIFIDIANIIGILAMLLTFAATAVLIIFNIMASSEQGRHYLSDRLSRFRPTASAIRQIELSRFANALSLLVASGVNPDEAFKTAAALIEGGELSKRLDACLREMNDPSVGKSLPQTVYDNSLFGSVYSRMVLAGSRSDTLERTLARLAQTFSDDALMRLDRLITNVEPILAGLLALAVCATLVAATLPLIAIMSSIA